MITQKYGNFVYIAFRSQILFMKKNYLFRLFQVKKDQRARKEPSLKVLKFEIREICGVSVVKK